MPLTSHLALDVGVLFLGPSFMMADPMGPPLDQDEEEALSPSLERKAMVSPPLSLSSYAAFPSPYRSLSSPLSPSSPPPSPTTFPTKIEICPTSFSWLDDAGDLLRTPEGADDKDNAFSGMDWVVENDLNDFDLGSLIGSCSSESPSYHEELLASLDSHMEIDPFDSAIPPQHNGLGLDLPLPDLSPVPLELSSSRETEVKMLELSCDEDVVVKSEPSSPSPSPCPSLSPSSPADTLALGSEVDVQEVDKTITTSVVPDPSGYIQTTAPVSPLLPPSTHSSMDLDPKDEPNSVLLPSPTASASPPSSACDSDSGIESGAGSPPHLSSTPPSPASTSSSASAGSSRTKPYSKPEPVSPSHSPKASRVKSVSGTPKVVEKKLKKMEQNKTAATRYRQKKRFEQEVLNAECSELEKRNHELAERAESISREIKYLKDLMEEVRNAKNRRSKTSSVA